DHPRRRLPGAEAMTRRRAAASLKARVTLLATALVGIVWLVAAAVTWFDARHEAEEVFDAHLAQAASLLIAQNPLHGETGDEGQAHDDADEHRASQLHHYARRVAFQLWVDGHLRLRSANAPDVPLGTVAEGFSDSVIDGHAWRVFSSRRGDGRTLVQVGERAAARQAMAREIAAGLLQPLVFALPLLAVLIWLAVRHGVQPLERVAGEVANRSPQRLEALPLDNLPEEARPLVERLNLLLGRLAESLEQERRFTADAAHELRTPLAGLRAQAQVAMGAGDEPSRQRAFGNLLEGCDRMAHLIDQLLILARVDAAQSVTFVQVDLAEVAREVVANLAPAALAKEVAIELLAGDPAMIEGNGTWLGALVRNLVDNAVRYSPPGSLVQVAVERGEGGVVLRVDDDGPGVSAEQLDRLGQRFQRGLSRNEAAEGESGSGLGLSIVRRVAELHGGTVQFATDRAGSQRGFGVRVSLPAPGGFLQRD
ncbi:MAG TPA: ATP-binding protein, partial [Rhodocyclaceae bacterium]|nr:ATP-binding protein [Rhodocyclaceae bacterium]